MSAPRVTDHALVRFLERAGGLDVKAMRLAIATSLDRAHTAAASIGGGDHQIVIDGLTFVVRGDAVVTVHLARGGQRRG